MLNFFRGPRRKSFAAFFFFGSSTVCTAGSKSDTLITAFAPFFNVTAIVLTIAITPRFLVLKEVYPAGTGAHPHTTRKARPLSGDNHAKLWPDHRATIQGIK